MAAAEMLSYFIIIVIMKSFLAVCNTFYFSFFRPTPSVHIKCCFEIPDRRKPKEERVSYF
jgi:hypothetical protein